MVGFLVEGSAQENLWRAVCDFPPASDDGRSWATLKASVLLTKVLETIHRAEALGGDLGLELAAISEAGCGIIRLYWRDELGVSERDPTLIANGIEELRRAVLCDGGSLVILSAPPAIKAGVDVWGPVGNSLLLMKELKQQFDPQRLLNPGRFVGGI